MKKEKSIGRLILFGNGDDPPINDANTVAYFEADIVSANDYYPFGMAMPGRNMNSGDYRYGFQGQEVDNEWLSGAVAFNYRVQDVRLGRFLSVDPLYRKYSYNSTYAFCENRVIDGVDVEGLEHEEYSVYLNKKGAVISEVEHYKTDVGSKGWGVQYNFYDANGKKVNQTFTSTDAPLVWTGKYRPLYINGIKVLGDSYDMEGEEGFYNGGWQTMVGSVTILIGGMGIAASGPTVLNLIGLGLAVDDVLKGGNKQSILEQLAGESQEMQSLLKFSKGTIGFLNKYSTALDVLNKGGDVTKYLSFILDTYGSIDNFKKAMDEPKKEINGKMKEISKQIDKENQQGDSDSSSDSGQSDSGDDSGDGSGDTDGGTDDQQSGG